MFKPPAYQPLTELDHLVFDATVPQDHYLRRVLQAVDFERGRPFLAAAYDPDRGRPACEPALLLKREFLPGHYNLSDRRVVGPARYTMAPRLFLGLSLHSPLPDPSLLSYFRGRRGGERHQQVFDDVAGQAREKGLVKDRLRLQDATHVLATSAIPPTIAPVAQTRGRLLEARRPGGAARGADEERRAEAIRAATADLTGEERLLQRVAHPRALAAWAGERPAGAAYAAAPEAPRRAPEGAPRLAHKVLADRDDPDGPDHPVSAHGPDARTATHGGYFTGYLLDVAADADSQVITALNVLPGHGPEAEGAVTLLAREERAPGGGLRAA